MKLSTLKEQLSGLEAVHFQLPDGSFVPHHFHVTEVGIVTKDFIDCGGTRRQEQTACFQLWQASDFDHRLAPQKLATIIALCETTLGMDDLEIEVEYQSETIGKYDLDFNGTHFLLVSKQTACLASDACGIKEEKPNVSLRTLGKSTETTACCSPAGECC